MTTPNPTAPRCTCARSCGLHSEDCQKYTPGHELASPHAELVRLREGYRKLRAERDELQKRVAELTTDTTPIPLHWDRLVMHPNGSEDDQTIVACTTNDGRPAALFLDDEHREALGLQLVEPDGDGEPDICTYDDLRTRLAEALDNAHKTQPCTCGATYWSYCGHDNKPSHSERRADAVLAAIGDYLNDKLSNIVDMATLLQDAERIPALTAKVKRAEEWARREEMARQKVEAQVLILGEQMKKRGVTNAEISEWIESVS